ncbi:MAG: WbqC family protein [Bacteroidales bacterium]|nr:WbqC family protein [Candidatus Cryptobacteroides caccocaballi]
MILSANQPYFMPYLAYWQLIDSADMFLVGDDYHYIRQGWIGRNRVLVGGEPAYIGINIKGASPNKLISEMEIADVNESQILGILRHNYCRAPYFNETMELMEGILRCPERNLSGFLTNSIEEVCRHIGISTRIGKTSDFDTYGRLKKEERIYEYCRILGADTYMNAVGGQELYSYEEFERHGVTLKFINSQLPPYPQRTERFVPGLSIIDVMMFNSKEQISKMLTQYSLIEK